MSNVEEFKCDTPGCPVGSVKTSIDSVKTDIETIRKTQEKFGDKQDQLIDAISNHKAILMEISNIKDTLDKNDDRVTRMEMGSRDNSVIIFQRINELEKGKADKDEVKEGRGWLWGAMIAGITMLLNILYDMFKNASPYLPPKH